MPDGYTIDATFDPGNVYYNGALHFTTPASAQNAFTDATSPGAIASGDVTQDLNLQDNAAVRSGQTDYNTGTGLWIGADQNGLAKFSLGNPSGNYLTWDGSILIVSGSQQIIRTLTAGADLAMGDAVFVATTGDGTDTSISQGTGGTDYDIMSGISSRAAYAQTFVTDVNTYQITTVTVSLKWTSGTPVHQPLSVFIMACSGGTPTGLSALGVTDSHLLLDAIANTYTDYTFTVTTNVTPSTTYAIVLLPTQNTDNNTFLNTNAAGGYAGGSMFVYTASGTSWNADTGMDWKFTLNEKRVLTGNAYKASAFQTVSSNSFMGFNQAAVSAGSSAPVVIAGSIIGLSGLSPGSFYYLSDTPGAISTSVGTNTRKVGIAVSATELLITNLW